MVVGICRPFKKNANIYFIFFIYFFLRFEILVTDSNASTVKNDTNMNGQSFTTETESKWMRPVMFGVFGLAGLLFFITVIYMYNFKHQQIKCLAVAETT